MNKSHFQTKERKRKASLDILKRTKRIVLSFFLTSLLSVTCAFSFVGCGNQYNNKYNAVILNSGYKFREGFLQENVTRAFHSSGKGSVFGWDENGEQFKVEVSNREDLPESILHVIQTKEEADAVFSEFPEDIEFEKHTACVYVFTTTIYRNCLIKKSNLQNGVLRIYFDFEENKTPYDPGATMPGSKYLVIKVDKVNADNIEIIKNS